MTTSKTKMATLTERAQEIAAAQKAQREAEHASKLAMRKREAISYLNRFFDIEFTNDMLRAEPHGYSEPFLFFELEGWEFRWTREWLDSVGHERPTLRVKIKQGKTESWRIIISLGGLANVPKTVDQRSTLLSKLFGRRAKKKS